MKKFEELTVSQKQEAVDRWVQEIKELISQGVLQADGEMTQDYIEHFANIAAEESFYAESEDKVIKGIA